MRRQLAWLTFAIVFVTLTYVARIVMQEKATFDMTARTQHSVHTASVSPSGYGRSIQEPTSPTPPRSTIRVEPPSPRNVDLSLPRVGILTFFSPDKYGEEMKSMTHANRLAYAARHGYEVVVASADENQRTFLANVEGHRYYQNLKFHLIRQHMEKFQWVFWNDADSVFLNFSRRLEDFLDDRFDVLVTAGPPGNPKWSDVINSGNFFVRNSAFGRLVTEFSFYLASRNCNEFVNGKTNGVHEICSHLGGRWVWSIADQCILQYLVTFSVPDVACHYKMVGFRDINSMWPLFGSGDLLVHVTGQNNQRRKVLFEDILAHTNLRTGVVDVEKLEAKPEYNVEHVPGMTDTNYVPRNVPCAPGHEGFHEHYPDVAAVAKLLALPSDKRMPPR